MTDGFADILIRWYADNHRRLPWRETSDPYLIWLSEVILQQTRVAQGLDYFRRFVARFPDVRSLAEAPQDEVLKLWQGLGYYSRARSLHTAAKDIMARFGGRFPEDYEAVRSLCGVGDYTAAAICSFAYELPYAAVDGNVYRVLSRVYDVDLPVDDAAGKRYFAELAQSLLDPVRPGLQNQATMEFGALQCVPQRPDCWACPLADRCLAQAHGTVGRRPVKRGKAAVRPRYFNYLCIRCDGTLLLRQRTEKDIWRNLYEFPLIETDAETEFDALQRTSAWKAWFGGERRMRIGERTAMPRHVLSHRIIYACFQEIELERIPDSLSGFLRVPEAELDRYAVSRLTERYLERRRAAGVNVKVGKLFDS